jgi:hypothetical protein
MRHRNGAARAVWASPGGRRRGSGRFFWPNAQHSTHNTEHSTGKNAEPGFDPFACGAAACLYVYLSVCVHAQANGAYLIDASDHNPNHNRNRNPFSTRRLRLGLRLR